MSFRMIVCMRIRMGGVIGVFDYVAKSIFWGQGGKCVKI